MTAPQETSTNSGSPNLASTKSKPELTKIRLESALLRRQLSRTGLLIEWLKASAVPAALIGTSITFIVGFLQIRQVELNRVADRFDKALARLSSDRPVERLSGASGLAQFLTDRDEGLRLSAYQYLHDAIVLESSVVVQSAILEIIKSMPSETLGQRKIDQYLEKAIKQNRTLKEAIERDSTENLLSAIKRRAKDAKWSEITIQLPLSESQERSLPLTELLHYYSLLNSEFYGVSASALLTLNGTSELITLLVRKGAKGKDFTKIFCTKCDFEGSDLAAARFDGSILRDSNFARANLQGSSFDDVDLSGVSFFRADLSRSKIVASYKWKHGGKNPSIILDCSDISGSELSLPLVHREEAWTYSNRLGYRLASSSLHMTVVGSAKIDSHTKVELLQSSDLSISDALMNELLNTKDETEVPQRVIEFFRSMENPWYMKPSYFFQHPPNDGYFSRRMNSFKSTEPTRLFINLLENSKLNRLPEFQKYIEKYKNSPLKGPPMPIQLLRSDGGDYSGCEKDREYSTVVTSHNEIPLAAGEVRIQKN